MPCVHLTCFKTDCMFRHTEEMIEKLETAGLGFYVRVSETQQKLGKNSI